MVIYTLGTPRVMGRLPSAGDADKVGNGAIVGAFGFRWEEAAGQFSHPPMVMQAFAAFALA
jgi:hypothetical protein